MTDQSTGWPSAGAGRVLRNAVASGPVQKLARAGGIGGPKPDVQLEAAQPAADQAMQADPLRLEEEFRRGYEKGLADGMRQVVDSAISAELEQARNLGLQQGTEAGLRAVQEANAAAKEQSLAALERMLAMIPGQLHDRIAGLEDDMLAICFEAVTRVLGDAAASPEGLRGILGQALAQYGARRLVEVRLHPEDLECLARDEVVAGWLRLREGGEEVQFVADPAIELGGMVLRSPAGRLDARLETQVSALRRALSAVRAARAHTRPLASRAHRAAVERPAPAAPGEPR